ncbi:polysaccharide deacetylase [Alsobacter soli]|uniref:Chitooligosaccharide deacetylase n=1 Tax=Alsobacter soli TaxID=2109933 RepID=A0A2T1HMX4_9HYPH|nr:polysaccharide deacetylase family protein [Alsobacter soli]PSC02998.1 polysaccharide deacetylase [Alsobacter soli]
MTDLPSRRAVAAGLFAAATPWPSLAAACPADRLGNARILHVGTKGGLQVGLKTYPAALPLGPKEVVLTFDDGPAPATTPRVLDALACEGAKATFFLIGRNAQAHPALVRRIRDEGHTLACHTWSHPWTMRDLSESAQVRQAEDGFKAIAAALGEPDAKAGQGAAAPFFRYPGFADTHAVNAWAAERDIGVFGCDLWASDWTKMTPEFQLARMLERLRHAGRGVILLHDIQPQTAAMLPAFLRALKGEGYGLVHLQPGPGRIETVAAPAGWTSETERIIAGVRRHRGA